MFSFSGKEDGGGKSPPGSAAPSVAPVAPKPAPAPLVSVVASMPPPPGVASMQVNQQPQDHLSSAASDTPVTQPPNTHSRHRLVFKNFFKE